ncbi:MAG: hypothetical protein U1A27_15005 [Phycisphaerae bacterium]
MSTAGVRDDPEHAKVHDWRAFCPSVDPERILRIHGYKDPRRIRPVLRRTAEDVARRITGIAEPEARWSWREVASLDAEGVELAGGIAFRCEAFQRLLAGADRVIAFVLTLGPRFDQTVSGLFGVDSNPLEGLFLETAGWLAVERLTRELAAHLRAEAGADGRVIGHRMGPGYSYAVGDRAAGRRVFWPLDQQHDLFRIFDGAKLPVALLDSAAMQPRMSRSGLFAVLPADAPTTGAAGKR